MRIFETLNDTRGAKKDELTTPVALYRGTLYPMHVASLLGFFDHVEFSLIRFRESARIASRLAQHEETKEGRKERHLHGTARHRTERRGTAQHGTAHTTRHGPTASKTSDDSRRKKGSDRNGAQYRERLFVSSTFTGGRSALECAFAPSSPSPLPYRARARGPQGPDSYAATPALSRHAKLDGRFGSQVSGPPTLADPTTRWIG